MKKVKLVNIVFMMSALMPYIAIELLNITGLQVTNSLQQIIFSQLVYVLPAFVYLIICRKNPLQSLRFKKVKISNVFLLIIFAYAILPVLSLINAISMIFSNNVISSTITNITDEFPIVIGILVVGLMPAIFEETVYRGVLYNEYRKANPKVAIILSALLFGLLHQNLNQFSYAFALGIIFALIIEATDSILSTMIIHFVINTNSVVMVYLLPKIEGLLQDIYGSNATSILEDMNRTDKITMIQTAQMSIIPAIIGSGLCFILYRTIARNEGRYEIVKKMFTRNDESMSVAKFISIPLVIGVGICIYNIVINIIYG